MKKAFFSFLIFLFAAGFVSAQNAGLLVKSSENGLYLEHKVVPKESFFSVGRLYNVSPKFLASYNKLDINKGLQIDQKIRIPLTDTNFVQQGNSGTPVYYKVGEKEGLMKVSKANRDVSLANLRSWNTLTSDNIQAGDKLIVGFLLTKGMMAVVSKEPVIKTEVKTDSKTKEKTSTTDPVVEDKAEKKEAKEEEKAEKKEEKKQPEPEVKKQALSIGPTDEGYFKTHFEQQIKRTPISKDETLTSGIFKTASGWQDAKYYLLIDAVQPGTIIKVINPSNNKVVYAKVLGEMSGIRQNEGLNIRLSNAAASALQVTEQDKFIVKVNY